MKKILSPYGIDPKELKQHLINIGFNNKKYNNDFELLNYISPYNKKYEMIEGTVYEILEEVDYELLEQQFYDMNNYFDEYYDFVKYRKEDFEDEIYYSKDCLIDPYDNDSIYDTDMDMIDENITNNDNENDDDNYYDNDYDYRKKKY